MRCPRFLRTCVDGIDQAASNEKQWGTGASTRLPARPPLSAVRLCTHVFKIIIFESSSFMQFWKCSELKTWLILLFNAVRDHFVKEPEHFTELSAFYNII